MDARQQRERVVKVMLEIVLDAFFHAKVPNEHFPSLEVMKHKIMPQVLLAAHAMFPVSGSSN